MFLICDFRLALGQSGFVFLRSLILVGAPRPDVRLYSDCYFMAMLKPLGIEKGKPFAPDA